MILILVFCCCFGNYGRALKTENDKIDTLVLLKIIEDGGNLDTNVTRAEFSKIIIRASEDRNKVADNLSEAVCNDVSIDTPYAAYINKSLEKGYMFTYLGGLFKPYDYVCYSDLTRASLALLSYTNDDFRGNQVVGRNLKFESLGLNENIDKKDSELLTKRDIINGIYNTLKEYPKENDSIYGTLIFDKLIIDSDKELNASEYKNSNVEGPFVVKSIDDIKAPFEITNLNVYINALRAKPEDLKDDIVNYGYAIYYIDLDNKSVCAYTERQDVSAPIEVRKGYIYKIYYAASNMLVPYRVDIDKYKYMLDSEEVRFAFSANGYFKEDDYIIYLCNKMNDVTNAYLDEDGNRVNSNEESEPYNGSIIMAFSLSEIK
ncbi:MAG: hypothetical protein IKP66_02680 [Lachnospiraceae bacterium]|nr:hypothetical protein [Lachnospiraceae bacterium]